MVRGPKSVLSSPRTRGPIRRVGSVLKGCRSSSRICLGRQGLWVPAFAGTTKILDRHSERLPFAQRLRVARRDIRVFRVFADAGQDLPRPRAFGAYRLFDHDGDAGNAIEPKRIRRRFVVLYLVVRGDAD